MNTTYSKSPASNDPEIVRNKAIAQEEDLQKKFPQLVGFLMAFIFDRGTDTALETAKKYAQTRNPEVVSEIVSDGKTLLRIEPFPWEFIQRASNDPKLSDASPHMLRKWIEEIITILETNSENRTQASYD